MKASQRVPGLDSLRAAAILAVIACHLIAFLPAHFPAMPPALTGLLEFGATGVDLFFVLSGFLIGGIILRELETGSALDLPKFYWRRWLRTLPAYLATVAAIFILLRLKNIGEPTGLTWHYLIFAQTYFPPPVVERMGFSWSLCVEEHFYVALPLLVIALRFAWARLSVKNLLRIVAVTAFVFSNVARLWIWKNHPGFSWDNDVYTFTHLRLDGLAVGLFVATLPRPVNVRVSVVLAVLSVAALFGLSFMFGSAFSAAHPLAGLLGFAPVALVYGGLVHVSAGGNHWSALRLPGARLTSDISYSLYLTHMLVIQRFMGVKPGAYSLLLLAGVVVGCYAGALALRYLVEMPFLKVRDNFAPFQRWRGKLPEPSVTTQ